MYPRNAFFVWAVLAASAATPAFAQNRPAAIPPLTLAQNGDAASSARSATATAGSPSLAAPVPDFSGIWAHLFWPDVDAPLSGPGPVVNLSRLPNGVSNPMKLVGDYTNPILNPRSAAIVKARGDMQLHGETYPTPSNQCWPGGVPFMFWNIGIQMFQETDSVTILYSYSDEVRHIRLNASHPAHVTPSWYGDSVGHYEGDTLVVDTIGVKLGPFAMVDMYGTPYTAGLHVIERYRLIDDAAARDAQQRAARRNFSLRVTDWGWQPDPNDTGKGLQLEYTVEDSGAFTMPWSATMTYRRPLGDWPEYICAEGRDTSPGAVAAVPTADKPDF